MKRYWIAFVVLLLPVFAQAQWTTHGFTIPVAHPRLYWNSTRITAGQAWLAAHPFTDANTPSSDPNFALDVGMKHVLTAADCSSAITWATGYNPSVTSNDSVGNDLWRWYSENAIVTYDWCHDQWTSGQISTFVTNMNAWVSAVQTSIWGRDYYGTWMTQNNYYLGYFRSELEWGIASYGETGQSNVTADGFIDDAINVLWAHYCSDGAPGGPAAGGVPMEGSGYGTEQIQYPLIPVATVSNMGRDLLSGCTFQRDLMYWNLYWSTPAATAIRDFGNADEYTVADFSDALNTSGSAYWSSNFMEDWQSYYAQHAALYYPTTPLAGYARQWLSLLSPVAPLGYDPNDTSNHNYYVSNYLISNDPGSANTSYSSLPLDYWATGPQYGVSKTAWDTSSTVVTYFMGTPIATDQIVGHQHQDWGSFSIWRGGKWVMRNDTGYSNSIAGTPNVASGVSQNISPAGIANNTPLFSNVEFSTATGANTMPSVQSGPAVTDRLSSQPGYFYLDADLSALYKWGGYPANDPDVAGHVEREFIYVRSLETLVVLDRILTTNQVNGGSLTAAQVATSFVTHYETNPTITDSNHYSSTNGGEILRQTVLVPASATYRVINEGGGIGQYRVEVDNSGAAQRYSLDVLQSSASGTGAVTASVVDSNSGNPASGTFTVTLHPATGSDTTVVFNKGETSSGGTINVAAGGAVSLTSSVEAISYTDAGPVWGSGTTYTLSTATAGTGTGTISCSPSGSGISSGTAFSCTVTAGGGSTLASVSGCGGTGTTTYTGTMPASNCTVTATFNTSGPASPSQLSGAIIVGGTVR